MDNGIFVSHSKADHEWCVDLVRVLTAAGYDVWYDSTSLTPGVSWIRTIEREIIQRDYFILVDSPDALDSDWVREEIELALNAKRTIIRLIHAPTSRIDFITSRQGLDVVGLAGDMAAERVLPHLPHLNGSDRINAAPNSTTVIRHDHYLESSSVYGATSRKLPLYVLLDCSESMEGPLIEDLREVMQMLYDEWMDYSEFRSRAHVSVITFGGEVTQTDLVPANKFVAPMIAADGARRLDSALTLLVNSIEHDLRRNTPTARGDLWPLVFILISGPSSNSIEEPLARLKALHDNLEPQIVAILLGRDANVAMVRPITDYVFTYANLSGERVHEIFSGYLHGERA